MLTFRAKVTTISFAHYAFNIYSFIPFDPLNIYFASCLRFLSTFGWGLQSFYLVLLIVFWSLTWGICLHPSASGSKNSTVIIHKNDLFDGDR